jgi:hypothetical protein
MSLVTLVYSEIFGLIVIVEKGCIVCWVGFVRNVAEEVEEVFKLGADELKLLGRIKADVSVECLSGFKFIDALISIRLFRDLIYAMLNYCALDRWLV